MFRQIVARQDQKRINRVVEAIQQALPNDSITLLDIGCGNGVMASRLVSLNTHLVAEGVDVVALPHSAIPVSLYDGERLPFADNTFDVALCIDMLHHTEHPERILAEAARVSRHAVIVKDHIADNRWDRAILTILDWIGNYGTGVPMPFNFLSTQQWNQVFTETGLVEQKRIQGLQYWPWPISLIVDRQFHFVARLTQ